MTIPDKKMMQRAIVLARKGTGKTSPNPAVGCVIVRDGIIVGEGWHKKAGSHHAEINALHDASEKSRGADVYVTLEPCSHFGKTPPCADALIAAQVAKVFIGMVDPNPKVSGKGIAKLRAAGIEVVTSVLEDHCRLLNEPFIKHVTTGLPFVILKIAMTMDGKIATAKRDSKWITNDKSRRYVHRLRSRFDAIMVGVGTVICDDPLLTSRITRGRDPVRIIVDSQLRIPMHSQVLNNSSSARTVIATTSGDDQKRSRLQLLGTEIIHCPCTNNRVDLRELLKILGDRGFQSIFLEGGAELAGEALRQGLVDKCMFFYAPKLIAGEGIGPFSGTGVGIMADAFKLEATSITTIYDDILIQGYPEKKCLPV